MRKEITFDEYVQALEIVRMYEEGIEKEVQDYSELERINEIKKTVKIFLAKYECNKSRKEDERMLRFGLMKWLKTNTTYSLSMIGRIIGKYDHATVINACKRWDECLWQPEKMRSTYFVEANEAIQKYFGHLTNKEWHKAIAEAEKEQIDCTNILPETFNV